MISHKDTLPLVIIIHAPQQTLSSISHNGLFPSKPHSLIRLANSLGPASVLYRGDLCYYILCMVRS